MVEDSQNGAETGETTVSQQDLQRLRKVLAYLNSDQEGEALAALRAARRIMGVGNVNAGGERRTARSKSGRERETLREKNATLKSRLAEKDAEISELRFELSRMTDRLSVLEVALNIKTDELKSYLDYYGHPQDDADDYARMVS